MCGKMFESAENPKKEGGEQYHVNLGSEDISKYVLLPGDPDRIPKISQYWSEREEKAYHREYRTHTGVYKGKNLSATSTGIGSPSAAIAVEELSRLGSDTFIRVGSCGAIQPDMEVGDLIIARGSVRLEGASKEYVRPEYPAVADHEVVLALISAAERLGFNYHLGIMASTDSFFTGQGRKGKDGYYQSWMEDLIPDLRRANVTNFEMESSAILTLANLFGLRAGCVCTVFADREGNKFEKKGENRASKVGNEAIKILNRMDQEKNGELWSPYSER